MTRIDMARTNKLGYAAVIGMEAYSSRAVEKRLYELIKLRASILNGCGFCVDMHATAGAKHGIPQRTMHAVGAWQHARNLFEPKELAALALTDAMIWVIQTFRCVFQLPALLRLAAALSTAACCRRRGAIEGQNTAPSHLRRETTTDRQAACRLRRRSRSKPTEAVEERGPRESLVLGHIAREACGWVAPHPLLGDVTSHVTFDD